MNDWVQMVREFHAKHGNPMGAKPQAIPVHRMELHTKLIDEEVSDELIPAMFETVNFLHWPVDGEARKIFEPRALTKIADGIGDSIYVLIGAATEYGIDIDKVFREIHRSNMTKDIGANRPDGKITKGPTFEPPRIREIIEEAMKR